MTKPLAYVSFTLLGLVAASIVYLFVAVNYPAEPKILDIDLPLRIRQKEVRPDDYITYETTYTQYKTLEATVITYLIPANSTDEHIELTRTKTRLPEAHNQHARNNVFIPPGTQPGEYMIHIHVEYEWNRFRTVPLHLGSDNFVVLNPDGSQPPRTQVEDNVIGKPDPTENVLQGQTPAVIEVRGKAEVQVTGGSPSATPGSDDTPEAENEPSPTPRTTPTPTPSAQPSPTPTSPPLCDLLPILC